MEIKKIIVARVANSSPPKLRAKNQTIRAPVADRTIEYATTRVSQNAINPVARPANVVPTSHEGSLRLRLFSSVMVAAIQLNPSLGGF